MLMFHLELGTYPGESRGEYDIDIFVVVVDDDDDVVCIFHV